jgi:hypothetical protein
VGGGESGGEESLAEEANGREGHEELREGRNARDAEEGDEESAEEVVADRAP